MRGSVFTYSKTGSRARNAESSQLSALALLPHCALIVAYWYDESSPCSAFKVASGFSPADPGELKNYTTSHVAIVAEAAESTGAVCCSTEIGGSMPGFQTDLPR